MSELTIREMGQDEDFSAWFSELLDQEGGSTTGFAGPIDEHYLILSNDVVVLPQERHKGHAHRLLAAFEERAAEAGGHLAEFWTDDQRSEGLLGALGWRCILQRDDYIGHRTWALMEKRLESAQR